ncbi:MAG: ParB/RepB/Spo0J family partition protein [Corynebacterium sp.]|nr:ParB/RepB/Spo0J family partition protein [Corynebacterium sp.]
MANKKKTRSGGLGRGLESLINGSGGGPAARNLPPHNRPPRSLEEASAREIADIKAEAELTREQNKRLDDAMNARFVEPTRAALNRKAGSVSRSSLGERAADIMFGSGPIPDADKKAIETYGATYRELDVDTIMPNHRQPRMEFDERAMEELETSIKLFGVMQPIVVRPVKDGEKPFELIMGERRLRASKAVGLKEIPAIIRVVDDADMLRDALLENIHREDLNAIEEAFAYQQLLEEFGVSQAELAERIGRGRSTITNCLRLLDLPAVVQNKLAANVISSGHARSILSIKVPDNEDLTNELRVKFADKIVNEDLSVRDAERAAASFAAEQRPARPKKQPTPLPEFYATPAETLSDRLDTKVSVTVNKKNRGKIVVEFGSQDDFERIIKLLK